MALIRRSNNLNDAAVWTPVGDTTFVTTPYNDGLTGWRGSNNESARLSDVSGTGGIYPFGVSTLTVGAWVKLLGPVPYQVGIVNNTGFNLGLQGGMRFGTHTNNRIEMACTRQGNQVTTTRSVGGFLNETDFKYVVGTCDGDDIRLFVDGVKLTGGQLDVENQTQNGGFTSNGFNGNTLTMLIGGTSTTVERFLNAEIHRTVFYDNTLTDAEVLALYNFELAAMNGSLARRLCVTDLASVF